jgi:hypothetical protein
MRSIIRPVTAVLAATTLASCMEMSGPTGASRTSLAIVPRFSHAASLSSATLAQAGLSFNSVRVVIVRPATDTLKDTTIVFSPTSPALTLELSILATPSEDLVAGVQFKQDQTVMFSGTANVKAVQPAAAATATPVEVVVNYTGPGAGTASIQIAPAGGLYSASSNTQFTAKAFDSQNTEITGASIFWSVSDPTKAAISSTGLLTPTGNRGTIKVTATAANGISKSVEVSLAPAAVGLRVIQGAGQKGTPGSTLDLAAVVELYAADGLPAASSGQSVAFSASAGASITPATATIGADGRASAKMTVGTSAGTTYLFTATVGTMSVSWGGSAAPGTPTHFVVKGSTTFVFTEGTVPSSDLIPTVRIADAQENSVAGVPLKVSVFDGTTLKGIVQLPSDSVGILSVYKVSPLQAGNYKIIIEAADAALNVPSVTFTVTVNPKASPAPESLPDVFQQHQVALIARRRDFAPRQGLANAAIRLADMTAVAKAALVEMLPEFREALI